MSHKLYYCTNNRTGFIEITKKKIVRFKMGGMDSEKKSFNNNFDSFNSSHIKKILPKQGLY